MSLVRVHTLMGHLDLAFGWLNKALSAGFASADVLKTDIEFAHLKSDPRFHDAMKRADQNANPCEYDQRYRQFDFWIGDWNVFDGQGNQVGTNSIQKIVNGCALLENWMNTGGIPGKSLNYFDPSDQQWHQVWVDASGGAIQITGGLDKDGSMILVGVNIQTDGTKLPFRGAWTLLPDGRVRQFFEQSSDGGKTWLTWFEGFYARK